MKKLWQKNQTKLHPLVEKYTVGDDYIWDKKLILYDIQASQAHAEGLKKIKILSEIELKKIKSTLNKLIQELKNGKITVTIHDEDCHTVIENYLIKELGDVGKKIHTGRSRNDQVLVATRLYLLEEHSAIQNKSKRLIKKLISLSEKYALIPLPGYSHTQQAMLSSIGHYLASFSESLTDDLEIINFTNNFISKNPLGSAAGFGVNLPLDRKLTTKLLNFKNIQINSLYCQNSRGKFESLYLEGLTQIMMTLGRFANDMLFFTSRELSYFSFPDELTTGSSIMPQKKNLDALEILRAKVNFVIANQDIIKNISKNLLSGYNRDLQLIKKPLFESIEITKESLDIIDLYLTKMKINEENIISNIKPDIIAADIANDLAKTGMPFRDAYREAMNKIGKHKITKDNLIKNIKSKISLGSPGNIGLVNKKH